MRTLPLLLLSLFLSLPAYADEGRLEINEACALDGGCFTGDTGGWPVTVSAPGSYVLTGELALPGADTTAILVSADGVQIDLNGFAVRGPVACTSATPFECTPAGSGVGIAGGTAGLAVRNGTVTGFAGVCIAAGARALIDNLELSHCGGGGVAAGPASIVRGSRVRLNGWIGIVADEGSLVHDNTLHLNHGIGIAIADAALNPQLGGYRDNVLLENNGGGAANAIIGLFDTGGNVCPGRATCSTSTGCNLDPSQTRRFNALMWGCRASASWPMRADFCLPGWHVCSAREWVERRAGVVPSHNYWTDDNLRFTGTSVSCSVDETVGGECPVDQPMRVCGSSSDSFGNTCNWTGCGYQTVTPNEYFGGCNGDTSAGVLCCL